MTDSMLLVHFISKEEIAGEPKRAQMTVFYAGEVIVFNDFPADKAKEIMLLASGGSGNADASGSWKTPSNSVEKLCSGDAVASSSKAAADPVFSAAQESPQQPQTEANTSGSLIADSVISIQLSSPFNPSW